MKKYVKLKCSVCERQKDQLIDSVHYKPDRCTITLGCEGRLSPIGFTSDGKTILSAPPTGASNWYPRGSTVTSTAALKSEALYDTSTGKKRQFVIAVQNDQLGFAPGSLSTIKLDLDTEQQTAKDYRQYTYRKSVPFTSINGVEDGQAKKVLRYSTSDEVQVYLNGVKRDLGADYLLYDGTTTSAVPPNTVTFTSTITGTSNQVDIIVTQATPSTITTIELTRSIDDESRANSGAWEGIDYVKHKELGDWSLFYCDFSEISTTLPIDVKLRFKEVSIKNTPTDEYSVINFACILLSRTKVYTPVDRQRAKWVPLYNLDADTGYLVIKMIEGERALLITESSAVDVFPILDLHRFGVHKLQTTNLIGNDDSAELDNQTINGPDV